MGAPPDVRSRAWVGSAQCAHERHAARRPSVIISGAYEVERVLRAKLGLDDESINSILALVEEVAIGIVDPPTGVTALNGDPDDDRIVAAALAGGAEVLVSGDRKHRLPLDRVGTMRVLRPQDLLAEAVDGR